MPISGLQQSHQQQATLLDITERFLSSRNRRAGSHMRAGYSRANSFLPGTVWLEPPGLDGRGQRITPFIGPGNLLSWAAEFNDI